MLYAIAFLVGFAVGVYLGPKVTSLFTTAETDVKTAVADVKKKV